MTKHSANTAYSFLMDFTEAQIARAQKEYPDAEITNLENLPPEAFQNMERRTRKAFAWLAEADYPTSFFLEAGQAMTRERMAEAAQGREAELGGLLVAALRGIFKLIAECEVTQDDFNARPYLARKLNAQGSK